MRLPNKFQYTQTHNWLGCCISNGNGFFLSYAPIFWVYSMTLNSSDSLISSAMLFNCFSSFSLSHLSIHSHIFCLFWLYRLHTDFQFICSFHTDSPTHAAHSNSLMVWNWNVHSFIWALPSLTLSIRFALFFAAAFSLSIYCYLSCVLFPFHCVCVATFSFLEVSGFLCMVFSTFGSHTFFAVFFPVEFRIYVFV